MAKQTDYRATRIAALEQLIALLRKQQNAMRASLADKDARIEALQLKLHDVQYAAHSSEAIHR